MTSAADRAQLGMWGVLAATPELEHFARAEVAGLVAIAERLAAEVAALEDRARADAAEIAGLRAAVSPMRYATGSLPPAATATRINLALLPDRPDGGTA